MNRKEYYKEVNEEMALLREEKHHSNADIERIIKAKKTGKWKEVFESKLYQKYSGHYCSLLEAMNRVRPKP